jgi:hypothetical protein
MLDMSKAFDCAVYDIMLQQLEHIGISGNAQKIFQTYLCDRRRALQIDFYNLKTKTIEQVLSCYREVVVGVPQGSVLGPLLFLIYLNEFSRVANKSCVGFKSTVLSA